MEFGEKALHPLWGGGLEVVTREGLYRDSEGTNN